MLLRGLHCTTAALLLLFVMVSRKSAKGLLRMGSQKQTYIKFRTFAMYGGEGGGCFPNIVNLESFLNFCFSFILNSRGDYELSLSVGSELSAIVQIWQIQWVVDTQSTSRKSEGMEGVQEYPTLFFTMTWVFSSSKI